MTIRLPLPEVAAELERLGLRWEALPGLAMVGDVADFVKHLQSFAVGSSWRDVLPDLPAHWELGRPETWISRYVPLGPFDYPELPTGPAVHVYWPKETGITDSPLKDFVDAAEQAGWPVYGAGVIETLRSPRGEFHAYIVLERGTSEEQFFEFLLWIEDQPGVEVGVVIRSVDEKFLE